MHCEDTLRGLLLFGSGLRFTPSRWSRVSETSPTLIQTVSPRFLLTLEPIRGCNLNS